MLGRIVRWALAAVFVAVIVVAAITGCDAYLSNPAWRVLR
jgi:hypothetical protein